MKRRYLYSIGLIILIALLTIVGIVLLKQSTTRTPTENKSQSETAASYKQRAEAARQRGDDSQAEADYKKAGQLYRESGDSLRAEEVAADAAGLRIPSSPHPAEEPPVQKSTLEASSQ